MMDRPRGRELGDGSREWPDDPDDEAADSPAIVVTFFSDYAAATKREQVLDLTDLARQIETTTGPDKGHLPWLKLAKFGDIITDKDSLRHDANILAVTGIEADYDGEQISFEEAHDTLGAAGLLAILYTSPSYREDAPRWRVLCPFSQEYPPDRRDAFLARLNGLFGGIFSRESWTRSQSYYFGSVNSNPSHRVAVLAGKPIDQAVELDDSAIGKPVKPEAATRPAYPTADPSKITDKRVNGKIESLLDNIRAAQDQQKHYTLWDNALAIGGYLHLTDWTDEQAVEKCIGALPSAKDWNLARRTAAEAIAKGRLKPLYLEERPLPPRRTGRIGNGGAPPPPPDVCRAMDIANPGNVAARLDDDEKDDLHTVDTPGGQQHAPEQPEPDARPDDTESDQPPSEGDQDTGPDRQAAEAEDAEAGDGQGDAPRELYGPPTEAEFIAELADLDEIALARIVKAKAALLGVDVPTLTKRVQRARSEAKTRVKVEAKAAEREARTKEKAAEAARKKVEAEEKTKQLPPLTETEVAAEIERLAKLSDAAFYAERPAAALRLRCSPSELTELVRRAKADYARKNATIPPFVTEQDVMRAFVTQYSDDLRFNHSNGSWLVWAEHFWQPDQRKLAFFWSLHLCKQMAPSASDEGRAVVEKVRFSAAVETAARVMPAVATAQEDWDSNPWLLGTPGGVVDLRTGILRPGNRRDMITKTTAVTPAISPDCPTWDALFDFAMHGDDQLVRFLQRYFGYCLTGLTNEEIFLFLFGPGGAGKGTLMETVAYILGDYAGTAPMEVFTGQSWSPTEYYRADMVGKRLIVANEPERGAYWAEAFIRESTGGDTLSGRHPAGRPFRFKPTHKMALSGNHMPRLRGRSTGMERRLRILPFTRKPETPDTSLKTKLLAEAPAILRRMIEGCLAWQRIGLQPPDAVKTANARYFEAQDAFAHWVDECCILDRYLQLDPSTLRASFNAWAKANGEDEMSGNAFSEAIDQFEPPETTPPTPPLTRGRANGKRFVKGIGLKPPPAGTRWEDRA